MPRGLSSQNRLQAIAQGKTLYEGKPCKHCKNTLKTVKNNYCHYCLTKKCQSNTISRINQFRARLKYENDIDLGFLTRSEETYIEHT